MSLVYHFGSHDSGHFITFRRFPKDPLKRFHFKSRRTDEWFSISDEQVYPISESQVFAPSSQVYLLFYERVKGITRQDAMNLMHS